MSREFSFVSLPYDKKVKPDSDAPDAARCDNVSGSDAGPGAGHEHAPVRVGTKRIGVYIAQINITRCKSEKDND